MKRDRGSALFTENNLHNWVGEAQFARGMEYVRLGLVIPHVRRRRSLSGWCVPRDGQRRSYYVTAEGNGMRVTAARCTCSIGKHGICPHIAAVLYTYLREPEAFHKSWWETLIAWWKSGPKSMVRSQKSEGSMLARNMSEAVCGRAKRVHRPR